MYVAVKGGEAAIDAAHAALTKKRRGDPAVPDLSLEQIDQQLALAVDRVMLEGSVYDRELAALAVKQARGDLLEAIFLLRAYRTTLPRLAASLPLETGRMAVARRISATFKDLPGGQVLGATFDYTHRLLDFALAAAAPPAGDDGGGDAPAPAAAPDTAAAPPVSPPRVSDLVGRDGLIEPAQPSDPEPAPADLTRQPLRFPAGRDLRLQALARGDEGFLVSLAYSSQRGHGTIHPFAGEIRQGEVAVEIVPEELGFPVTIGTVAVTECEMFGQFTGSQGEPPRFTRGYGLTFGESERKAMAMAIVDRALRSAELGGSTGAPAQDVEFVLPHSDTVEASGFLQHLKLPHYVDFQSELEGLRRMHAGLAAAPPAAADKSDAPDDGTLP
ncbi:MAG: carbon-phosphorus lyase complex subunit PhnI [Rhodospirillaceae bacterium]|nr:carbon-phosphorus lyase complex subunit PhnI [Rhodospirillaceae bacterium]